MAGKSASTRRHGAMGVLHKTIIGLHVVLMYRGVLAVRPL